MSIEFDMRHEWRNVLLSTRHVALTTLCAVDATWRPSLYMNKKMIGNESTMIGLMDNKLFKLCKYEMYLDYVNYVTYVKYVLKMRSG